MNIFEFTRHKFLALTLMSHIALIYVLIFGTFWQILAMFAMFASIIPVASTATYHRLLSHRSWPAPRWFEIFGTLLGVLSFTGTSITRTVIHRYHHAFTDTDKDPHTPWKLGKFRTYFPMLQEDRKFDLRLVSDLLRDPFHVFLHRYYFLVLSIFLLVMFFIFSFPWFLALFVAPGALCWMNISICNIWCHLGPEDDKIVNSRLLAILTFGEGWHKYHHDYPNEPDFGQGKWDRGFWVIKLFSKKK